MLTIGVTAVYFLVVIVYVVLYFFIVYHLVKYSLNASLNRLVLPVFVVISVLLLLSNIMLFFSVDWKNLIHSVTL